MDLNKSNILSKLFVAPRVKDTTLIEREKMDVHIVAKYLFIIKSYYILYVLEGKHDDPLVRMILRQGEIISVLIFSSFLFFFSCFVSFFLRKEQ